MREILFRGKRIDTGEWAEGSLLTCGEGRYFIAINPSLALGPTAKDKIENETLWGFYPFFEVDSETIGQYTGLTDGNGKKIFEGDICRMKADRLRGYGATIFSDGAFVLCDKTHKQTRYYPLYPDGRFVAIGNIHDNPELVEVTK